ncbi:MaoC family dehydratase [Chelatococcus reniformis]|uniref:Acyl dehydratase n=1 Tax=Chelatococcus reniformis TaxID=1494448 RepID=A0A916XMM6_9HYPH|nr:MaoC family dehydratase [Chelatococcus reniformis]GGC87331.1 acyl dehydratase [Chelatococcus reniformis]
MTDAMPARLVPAEKVIDRQAIRLYAELTTDFNPIHLDPEFAAKSPMKGIIAHGMLSLNLVWQALRATFGRQVADGAVMDVRFIKPVREDDTVHAEGEAVADAPGRYAVRVVNQHGEAVIVGTVDLAHVG